MAVCDTVISNVLPITCELKSSITRAAMYTFERKARFGEKRHNCKASRLIVISPMVAACTEAEAGMPGIPIGTADAESL